MDATKKSTSFQLKEADSQKSNDNYTFHLILRGDHFILLKIVEIIRMKEKGRDSSILLRTYFCQSFNKVTFNQKK